MASICSLCGKEHPGESKVCDDCQNKPAQDNVPELMPEATCSTCKTPLKTKDKFCRKCGATTTLLAEKPQVSVNPPSEVMQEKAASSCLLCNTPLKANSKFCMKCGSSQVSGPMDMIPQPAPQAVKKAVPQPGAQNTPLLIRERHMMCCVLHDTAIAKGMCIGCGKPFCESCLTEIKGKNHCKNCLEEKISHQEKKLDDLSNRAGSPIVIMNTTSSTAAAQSTSVTSMPGVISQQPNTEVTAASGPYNRTTAALFAIFLGFIGVHKFYLGQTGLGILYVCFFWTGIPALVAGIESIIFLLMSDKDFNTRYNS